MLDRDRILKATGNGLFIFRHYISGDWQVNKSFRNPLYNDTKPSCSIYLDRKSKIYRMKDFGDDRYSGDCFYIVGLIHGYDCTLPKDFVKILSLINRDLSLGFEDSSRAYTIPKKAPIEKEKPITKVESDKLNVEALEVMQEKSYDFTAKQFSASELEFWLSYGITEHTLMKYNVTSISLFKSTTQAGKRFSIESRREEPAFGYVSNGYIKLYRPFSSMRFVYGGQVPENHIFGLSQLPPKGDILFITGGEKDVMSLATREFSAICFNSESAHIPESLIKRLTYRFKHIVILYDMDKTGKDSSLREQQKLSEYGVMRLLLPLDGSKESKDISDFFRQGNSRAKLKELFTELLCKRYSDTISILNSCKISLDQPPPETKVIISINDVPLGTNGNLLCITGGEGSGKSNFVGALIAGALNIFNKEIDTLGVRVRPTENKQPILLYDTEQSNSQLYKNSINIKCRAKRESTPGEFYPYSFTSLSRETRLQTITEGLDLFFHKNNGIHLVVIDGIADLISGANNETESVAVVEELYRLAAIYNTCIVCVLHFIPNGLKLRGHLGSELQRKAAAILSIERENSSNTSLVKALKVRDGSPLDIPIIQFSWNKSVGMHTYLGEKPKEEREKRKRDELQDAADKIFSEAQHLTYTEFCDKLQACCDVQQSTAKKYVKYMRESGIVVEDPSNTSYLMIGLKEKK